MFIRALAWPGNLLSFVSGNRTSIAVYFQRGLVGQPGGYFDKGYCMFSQLTERLNKTLASQRRNDEELKDMREKNDQVAHWEAQIAEIIQWYH